MKYVLTLGLFFAFGTCNYAAAQAFQDETSFLTVVIPTHFIQRIGHKDADLYESKKNRAILSLSKEYKGLEDSFISASSACSFNYKMLEAEEKNVHIATVNEKVGKLQFSILTWSERGERNRITNHIRAYNDAGEFIHCFEMSSFNSNPEQLKNAFYAFLRTCRPIK